MSSGIVSSQEELVGFYDWLSRLEFWRARLTGIRDPESLTMHKSLAATDAGPSEPRGGRHGIDDWLAERVTARPSPSRDEGRPATILDIGCGFGASLRKLTRASGARGIGITLSPYQRRIAHRFGSDSLRFFVGNFEDQLPSWSDKSRGSTDSGGSSGASDAVDPGESSEIDIIISIETLVYATDLDAAMQNLAQVLGGGGSIFLIEDMYEPGGDGEHADRLRNYQELWHLHRVFGRTDFERAFTAANLSIKEHRDFTARVTARGEALLTPRIRTLERAGRVPWPSSIRYLMAAYLGGFYLETLYDSGAFSYRFYHLVKNA